MGVGEGSWVGVAAGMRVGDGGVEEVGAGAQAARSSAARKRIGLTTRANWCILMYRKVISNQYSSNLIQISCPVAHRLKSGLRASGRLSACADNPSFKKIDCKFAAGNRPRRGTGGAGNSSPHLLPRPSRSGGGSKGGGCAPRTEFIRPVTAVKANLCQVTRSVIS